MEGDTMNDYLRCTDCGRETNVTAESLYESFGKTKAGKWRKRRGWLKVLSFTVTHWLCDDCLTVAEIEQAAE